MDLTVEAIMNARNLAEPWRTFMGQGDIRITEHLDDDIPIVIVDLDEPFCMRSLKDPRYLIVVQRTVHEQLLTELQFNDRELAAWILWNRRMH
jgi:hypothetical protein